jgi:hypothetical protein
VCKIWYLISRTVSDDDPHCGDIDDPSVRAFAVKPAPSARRDAALGLTARRGRANPATVPLMHSLRCSGNHGTRLSDNVRQVECWFSQLVIVENGYALVVFGKPLPEHHRLFRIVGGSGRLAGLKREEEEDWADDR